MLNQIISNAEAFLKPPITPLRKAMLVVAAGGVGGLLAWLLPIMDGNSSVSWPSWLALTGSVLLGMGAGFSGLYLLYPTDTQQVGRCMAVALVCGLSWHAVLAASVAYLHTRESENTQKHQDKLIGSLRALNAQIQTNSNEEVLLNASQKALEILKEYPEIISSDSKRAAKAELSSYVRSLNAITGPAADTIRERLAKELPVAERDSLNELARDVAAKPPVPTTQGSQYAETAPPTNEHIGLTTAASASSGESPYTVKRGDSLIKIASELGVKVKALRAANKLSTDKIRVGQRLRIPAKFTADASTPTDEAPAGATAPRPTNDTTNR
jgi:LysM repeat protein